MTVSSWCRSHSPPAMVHVLTRFVTLFLLIVCTLPFYAVASEAEEVEEVILVTPGRLSSSVSPPVIFGAWPHGDGAAADALFFDEEDAAHAAWVAQQRATRKERGEKAKQAKKEEEKKKPSKKTETRKEKGDGLTSKEVSARGVARRAKLRALRNETNPSQERMWDIILSDALALLERVHRLSVNVTDGAENQTDLALRYNQLANGPFAHTLSRDQETVGDSGLRSGFVTDYLWPAILPRMLLLDGEAITAAEREVRAIESDANNTKREENHTLSETVNRDSSEPMKQSPNTAADEATTKKEESAPQKRGALGVHATLSAVRAALDASRAAHAMTVSLAAPLLPPARAAIASRLREAERHVLANDESTAARRRELREWTRLARRLRAAEVRLADVARSLRAAALSPPVVLPPSALLDALSLVARRRLDRPTGDGEMDAVPPVGPSAAVTAAGATELRRPFAAPLVASIATAWALRATREFWVRRARRAAMARREAAPKAARIALRAHLVLEFVTPVVLPVAALCTRVFGEQRASDGAPLMDIVRVARPAQRLALTVLLATLIAASIVVSSLTASLYAWSIGKDKGRKKQS